MKRIIGLLGVLFLIAVAVQAHDIVRLEVEQERLIGANLPIIDENLDKTGRASQVVWINGHKAGATIQ